MGTRRSTFTTTTARASDGASRATRPASAATKAFDRITVSLPPEGLTYDAQVTESAAPSATQSFPVFDAPSRGSAAASSPLASGAGAPPAEHRESGDRQQRGRRGLGHENDRTVLNGDDDRTVAACEAGELHVEVERVNIR